MGLIKPLFIAAFVLILLTLLLEAGSAGFLDNGNDHTKAFGVSPPGYGVPYLALLDGLLVFTIGLMGLSLLLQQGVHAKIQGCITLIVSFLLLLGSIVLIVIAFVLLMIMVTLLLAPIFGTIAYFAMFADFDRSGAGVILSVAMVLKIAFALCLFFANPRFLENKGLVLLVLTSLLAQIITAFLHGFPPGFLVSITDAIAGIITGILTAIWCIVFLIGSIISVVKALRVDRGTV
ncbi:MAG: hypothetical protein JO332_01320 [Planctomycetaceae bacterium]|nr:hypothetical protein [Planctomycetaceae bacterium]